MSDNPRDIELEDAFSRVQHNPTDLENHFLLGECLFRRSRHKEAIVELQKARMHPRRRQAVLSLLADSFAAIGDQRSSEHTRQTSEEESSDDEDDDDKPGSSPTPAPLKPIDPKNAPAMNPLPENEPK